MESTENNSLSLSEELAAICVLTGHVFPAIFYELSSFSDVCGYFAVEFLVIGCSEACFFVVDVDQGVVDFLVASEILPLLSI